MASPIYWIHDKSFVGRLGIMARPRAGDWLDDEIASWRAERVATVLSLLEREEVRELELDREEHACRQVGIDFRSFAIADRSVPSSLDRAHAECEAVNGIRAAGKNVGVHCRAGIGRSSLMAACSLVLTGLRVDEAFALIGRARGLAVPDTVEQVQWVQSFFEYVGRRP